MTSYVMNGRLDNKCPRGVILDLVGNQFNVGHYLSQSETDEERKYVLEVLRDTGARALMFHDVYPVGPTPELSEFAQRYDVLATAYNRALDTENYDAVIDISKRAREVERDFLDKLRIREG